jgi:hypothetical protein
MGWGWQAAAGLGWAAVRWAAAKAERGWTAEVGSEGALAGVEGSAAKATAAAGMSCAAA